MAFAAHSIPAPSAQTPDHLAGLIDALIALADEIMGHGNEAQQDRLLTVISRVAALAVDSDVLLENARSKARAIRLIYAGHPDGFEDGFKADSLAGGSLAEQFALQVLVLMAVPK